MTEVDNLILELVSDQVASLEITQDLSFDDYPQLKTGFVNSLAINKSCRQIFLSELAPLTVAFVAEALRNNKGIKYCYLNKLDDEALKVFFHNIKHPSFSLIHLSSLEIPALMVVKDYMQKTLKRVMVQCDYNIDLDFKELANQHNSVQRASKSSVSLHEGAVRSQQQQASTPAPVSSPSQSMSQSAPPPQSPNNSKDPSSFSDYDKEPIFVSNQSGEAGSQRIWRIQNQSLVE